MKYLFPFLALVLAACNKPAETLVGLKEFQYQGGDHQEGLVNYKEALPVGGPHNPRWQNCGVYEQEIYNEYAVHSLEHGAVWITYRPNLSAGDLELLKKEVVGRTHMLLTLRVDQPSPIVLTAWNAQLEIQEANDPRIKTFIQRFEQGGTAPERGASCSNSYGGVR